MSFPRYPRYKPSGVEWLGDVPEHWACAPSKRSFRIIGGGTPSSDEATYWDGNVPWATPADLGNHNGLELASTQRSITAAGVAACNTTLVPVGSIVLSTRAPIGSLGIATIPLCTNQGCKALVSLGGMDSRYVARVLSSCTEALQVRGKGTTFLELSGAELGAFELPLPPIPEQRAIAAFLDRETAKIDALVAEQERLIELLKEKRQAVISHAVTKGLDPKAKMKPSGVEWLGDVPEHWGVRRLKQILADHLRYGANEAAEMTDPALPRFVRITDIDDSDCLRDDTFRSLPEEIANSHLLKDGDILFARSGATAGKSFLYRTSWGTCAHAGYLIRARLNRETAVPAFIRYFTSSANYWQWIQSAFIQSTIQNVSAERYADLRVSLPPISEQHTIVTFLDGETAKFDRLCIDGEQAVALLRERRAALISAAVTGQIDVRNAAPSAAAVS